MYNKKRQIRKSHIADLRAYKGSEEAELIFDYIFKNKFHIHFRKQGKVLLHTDFYKIHWLASDGVFQNSFAFSDLDAKRKTLCQDVLHSGIHYLIANAIGKNIKGCPKYALLSETMSSCTDFYFTLIYLKRGGTLPKIASSYLVECKKAFNGSDRQFLILLNQALEDPFKSFRATVKEMYSILVPLENLISSNSKCSSNAVYKIDKKAANLNFWPFIKVFDLPMFCYYVQKNCKPTFSVKDNARTKKLFNLLARSDDFADFVKRLRKLALNAA